MTFPEDAGLPLPYYLSGAALLLMGFWFFTKREQGFGLPAMAVLATAGFWYFGDVLYNDYEIYRRKIGADFLTAAWWQVLLFLTAFTFLTPPIHRWINRLFLKRRSFALICYESGRLEKKDIQLQLNRAAVGAFTVWGLLMVVALSRVEWKAVSFFAPYLSGERIDPWARGRLGGGIDALLSLAQYFQIFLTAVAGIVFALSRDPKVRAVSAVICLLAFPYYIFDRTRNTMLATILPGFLAWVLLRLKTTFAVKGMVLAVGLFGVTQWFAFVMQNRTDRSIAGAVKSEEFQKRTKKQSHEGLNMFEELGWVNRYIASGRYKVNWGKRYFAEAVNPIPRVLWKNKPLIGIDYAIARGQASTGGSNLVTATISTGMIGQGVVNFGRFLGPIAAATLMAFWVALLARQDLLGHDNPARLLLYVSGLILTFNMGRDITLLVMYPFLFGLGLFWAFSKYQASR